MPRLPWNISKVEPGQFITFLYKGKSGPRKRRLVLVLNPKYKLGEVSNKFGTFNVKGKPRYMLSGIDFGNVSVRQIEELFNKGLPKEVLITETDKRGFRYFELAIDDPEKLWNKIGDVVRKYGVYKTFFHSELVKTQIELENPKFSKRLIGKFAKLNPEIEV
jgi:hypothetical protein